MNIEAIAKRAFDQGNGILKLAPNWVPRAALVPGKRIKLHPDDYYVLGGNRGGISERWLSSTTPVDNGPLTGKNEGLSEVVLTVGNSEERILFRDVVIHLKSTLLGDRIWSEYGCWPMYSKFFDSRKALSHHVHYRDKHARIIGQEGKPEAYFFPVQLNNHGGEFPFSFFGLNPDTTKEEVIESLKNFKKGDNNITNFSRAFRLELGTGWDVPAGVLHAPGSLCTYEPQKNSDVYAKYQSLVGDAIVSENMLWKDTPEEHKGNYQYLIDALDWELNVDPNFVLNRFMRPTPVKKIEDMECCGYRENWICYKSDAFSAKELTVYPGTTVVIKDKAAYGMIMMQGFGKMDSCDIETPTLIRYGQSTNDEFFVSEQSAIEGVKITNYSKKEPIVMLKHFGPQNPEMVQWQNEFQK